MKERDVVRPLRALRVLAVVGLLLAVAPGVAHAREPAPTALADTNPVFWQGAIVQGSLAGDIAYGVESALGQFTRDPCVVQTCWAYSFGVSGNPDRLRVAIDTNLRTECYQLELYAPGDYADMFAPPTFRQACEDGTRGVVEFYPPVYNLELFVEAPASGTWTVRVVPFLVDDWGFRLRARVEEVPDPSDEIVLPNLRPVPPYEFGFVAPLRPDAGTAPDSDNPPGPAGISCSEDEKTEAEEAGEQAPERCLRLSAGIFNPGRGPLDLLLNPDGKVIQRIHSEDGDVAEQRPAGEWRFHEAHDHAHYLGYAEFALYRVSGRGAGKRLVPVSSGNKAGWHPIDQRFADWHSFGQGAWVIRNGRCAEGETCLGVTNGWGDHYRWQRPGNYVEFQTNADGSNVAGDYVVQLVIDREEHVTESNERDNVAYAWVRVQGDQVTTCERGLGNSPWDRGKTVASADFWLSTPVGTTASSPTETCTDPRRDSVGGG